MGAGRPRERPHAPSAHDALEEACRRLVAGRLPDTAGQPTVVQLHMTLDQLRGLPGAPDAERSFGAARAAGDGTPDWVYDRAFAHPEGVPFADELATARGRFAGWSPWIRDRHRPGRRHVRGPHDRSAGRGRR